MGWNSITPPGFTRVKPKVHITRQFDFFNNLEIGDTGTLIATVNIEGQRLQMEEGNDLMVTEVRILKANQINQRKSI